MGIIHCIFSQYQVYIVNVDLQNRLQLWHGFEGLHLSMNYTQKRSLRWQSMNLCNVIVPKPPPIAWLLEELNMSFVTKIKAPIQSMETQIYIQVASLSLIFKNHSELCKSKYLHELQNDPVHDQISKFVVISSVIAQINALGRISQHEMLHIIAVQFHSYMLNPEIE